MSSIQNKDLKRKSLEREDLTNKKVLKKPIEKPLEKSEYEKIRDQNVKEIMEEAERLGL